MARELGDFQTSRGLVAAILRRLGPVGELWPRVLEPTCGSGNFIAELLALHSPPREIQGIELQTTHFDWARELSDQRNNPRVVIVKGNIFDMDVARDLQWSEKGPLLILGNPPWVTSSELGALNASNTPRKENIKGLRGIDALTGDSNFDLTEYIWLKLLKELGYEQPTIALLCKTSVARKVLEFAYKNSIPFQYANLFKIDAKKHFGVSVDACLFQVQVGTGEGRYEVSIFPSLEANEPESVIGIVGGRLVSNIHTYENWAFADGQSPLTWRQGIKHDAAPVMELKRSPNGYANRLGEFVMVEEEYIYPLAKGSDIFHGKHQESQKWIVVPQQRLGQDTRHLESNAPSLWGYLNGYAEIFKKRKSSIYRNQPPFALFGIGDYSFAPYKVGVSGLHKSVRFRAIAPIDGKPVMLDDTCYFIPCHSAEQAAFLSSLLNDSACLEFIESICFFDSKRPITKKLLQRIDLKALMSRVGRISLLSRASVEFSLLNREGKKKPLWPSHLEEFLTDWSQTKSPVSQAQLAF